MHILSWVIQVPVPTDINQLPLWLLLPAVLGAVAAYFISIFGAPRPRPDGTTTPGWTDQQKFYAKLAVYLVIGLVSIVLQAIPPELLERFNMPFLVIVSVIAAFVGSTALHITSQVWVGMQLLGLRLLLGREAFAAAYTKSIKHPLMSNG